MKSKIKYDKESNTLTIRFSNKRSVDSEIRGNVVIDYDENREIIKIEIMEITLDEFKKTKHFTPLREFIKV
jgi:uncharacterized protein YuzE